MSDQPEPIEDELEGAAQEAPFRKPRGALTPSKASKDGKERARAGVREARVSDLNMALAVHGRLCDQMDKAGLELRAALAAARRLEGDERAAVPDVPRLSSSIKDVLEAVKSIMALAAESALAAKDAENGILKSHESVCLRVDSAARELHGALALSVLLDKSSGSGFNVEARLGRRLDVRGLQRTLGAAHSQVTRASRASRARAGSHGRAVEDLIEEVPAGFK